MNEVGIKLSTG